MNGKARRGSLRALALVVLIAGCTQPPIEVSSGGPSLSTSDGGTAPTAGPVGSADGTMSGGAGTGSATGASTGPGMDTGPAADASDDGPSTGPAEGTVDGGGTTTAGGTTMGMSGGTTAGPSGCAVEPTCQDCFTCAAGSDCDVAVDLCTIDLACNEQLQCILMCDPANAECLDACRPGAGVLVVVACLQAACPAQCTPFEE